MCSITTYFNFFTFLIVLTILQFSDSLRCYVCNSALHAQCGMSLPSLDYLVNCTDATALPLRNIMTQRMDLVPLTEPESRRNYTFCRKNIAYIPKQDNKDSLREAETRIVRSCGWVEPDKVEECKSGAIDGVHRDMCSCLTDECNSVPGKFIGSITSFATCSILFLISRILI